MRRNIVGVAIAIAAVPAGVIAGPLALLLTAGIGGGRPIAAVAAAASTAAVTWLVARPGARALSSRTWVRRVVAGSITAGVTGLVAALIGALLFGPVPTPGKLSTSDIQYWDLATGSRIAYVHAPGRAPRHAAPVVLVHGGPGSPWAQPPELAQTLAGQGFSVYAYHQVGAGLSGRLPVGEYTVARHVADLDAIRAEIGAERMILIGGSWGGTLIAHYLAAHSDRVERAVVESPGELWRPAYTDAERLTPQGRADQQSTMDEHPRFLLAHLLMRIAGPEAASRLLPDERVDGVFEAFVGDLAMDPGCTESTTGGTDPDPPAGFGFWVNAMTTADAGRVPDPRPALRSVTVPVLVLRGTCDYIAWEVTREYRDVLPAATLVVVAGAGHTVASDAPELYRSAVLAHLLDLPLPAPPYGGDVAPS